MKLQIELAQHHKTGLLMSNPVVMAAGVFGYGIEYAKLAEVQRLGAIISKSTTLRPYRDSLLVIKCYASIWETWQTPVIVNIAGETIGEFVQLAKLLESVPGRGRY
jgi:dihydroorotate dehydrogenase (NAD+) catalytic subunit